MLTNRNSINRDRDSQNLKEEAIPLLEQEIRALKPDPCKNGHSKRISEFFG
jgi:hypothetical protein